MFADPQGAAEIVPILVCLVAAGFTPERTGWVGKKRIKCSPTPMGPTPGPPPCGILNVLCRFRWATSAPILPGRLTPTKALKFAPSK